MPNLTADRQREGLIIRYSPYSLKSGLAQLGYELQAAGALRGRSPMLRQLLGLGLASGAPDVYA
jgi:hypothetical protein